MLRLTLVIGGILTALGILGYAATGAASLTALIPSAFGVALLACAAVAARRPGAHAVALHIAMVIALLGILGAARNVARVGELVAGTAANPWAVALSTVMAVLLAGYLAAGVRSFVAARRARTGG